MALSPPRVALFVPSYLPYSQTFVFDELRSHQRYAIEVFTWHRQLRDRFPHDPVHVASLATLGTALSGRFRSRLAKGDFGLAHAHFSTAATYALPYAKRSGLPLVVTFHGFDVPLLGSRARFVRPWHWPLALRGRQLLRDMALGLCASTDLRDRLLALGAAGDKLLVHPLGIDVGRFRPGERTDEVFRVMMVGRLVEKKGFDIGLRAFASAMERSEVRCELTIVGDGPLGRRLRELSRELRIRDRVEFTGSLEHWQVAELMTRTHVLLAPSITARSGDIESGLIVAKEAGACEAVVIGTNHGGIPEIIEDGVTGFLVEERDAAVLAQRLGVLAGSPDARRRMGAQARQRVVRDYSLEESTRRLEARYDRVLSAALLDVAERA